MTIWRGTYYNVIFNLQGFNDAFVNVPVDITGWTFRSQIRDKNSDKTPMIELTTENGGIAILNASDGQFEIRITADQNKEFSLGNIVGDMFRMDKVPGPERLFGFRDRVRRPVTRDLEDQIVDPPGGVGGSPPGGGDGSPPGGGDGGLPA